MRRHLPSLAAMQCFEASARHLSFTAAADELCLTQSAVSRQVKKLETFLGCALFERVKQRVVLTAVGANYAEDIRQLLDQAEAATRKITLGQSATIKIAAEPAIASRWLIPRLAGFKQAYPEVEVEIITDLAQIYGESKAYDVAIIYGNGDWAGLEAQRLMLEEMVAVATPALVSDKGIAAGYADIVNLPLLHHSSSVSTSQEWLQHAGFSAQEIQAMPGQRLEYCQLLLEGALQGLGVAILPAYFAREELENGQLVHACEKTLFCDDSYYVAIPREKYALANVNCFADWLLAQGQR